MRQTIELTPEQEAALRIQASAVGVEHTESAECYCFNRPSLDTLIAITPFCADEAHTRRCLEDLLASQECQNAITVSETLNSAQHDQQNDPDSSRYTRLQSLAGKLMDTRDALATAILNLKPASYDDEDIVACALRVAKLNLVDTFLAGAILHKAQLKGAYLQRSLLHGIDLTDADLVSSNFDLAQLDGATLSHARLVKASLRGVQLNKSVLIHADLSEANLTGSSLRGTILTKATLQNAILMDSQLQGAQLQNANLEGTWLYHAQVLGAGESANSLKSTWFGANWSAAYFRNVPLSHIGDDDDALQALLKMALVARISS